MAERSIPIERLDTAETAVYEACILARTLRYELQRSGDAREQAAAANGILCRIEQLTDVCFEALFQPPGSDYLPNSDLRHSLGLG